MDLFSKGAQNLVIDTSSSDLKLAVGGYNHKTGTVMIDTVGVIPLDSDVITDGAITDNFGVVMALKHAMAKLNIRTRSAILTTDGAFVHTKDLDLPKVKSEQLKDMVRYEVMGQGTNKDMIIDYVVYGTTKDEETNADKLQIRATAIPKDTVNDFRDFLKNMELTPVAMDSNPNAVRKLFSGGIINGNVNINSSTLLLIELSEKVTTITILDKGFPVLSRRLQFGHSNIRQVAESIRKLQGGGEAQSSLARRLNITKSDAESSVPIDEIDVWHETIAENPTLQSAVNAYFKSLVDAVSRTAQFSISKFHIDSISTCFLYGSGAGYKKIDKELSRQLGTQVEVLNTISTVAGPRDFMLPQFVNCCGALIRED
ncbi:MAG: pilus assembly protein PilM [Clostridiales bacterium]|nr:pilus assembly protein PilM [Clostridiales bacterium]